MGVIYLDVSVMFSSITVLKQNRYKAHPVELPEYSTGFIEDGVEVKYN